MSSNATIWPAPVPQAELEQIGAAPLSVFEEPRRQGSVDLPLRKIWRWLQGVGSMRLLQVKPRRLRVAETVSLGEKRFVSIVEVDGRSLLIGGGSAGVALLQQLDATAPEGSFHGALDVAWRAKESA